MKLTIQRQIRGSMLLVLGRGVSLVLNLVTQILCVRYLSKADYGSFAYAIAMIEILAVLNALGFEKSLPRFAAIYDENKDSRRFVGLLITSFGAVILFGLVIVLVGTASVDFWSTWLNSNPLAIKLLLLLILLAPIHAIDALMLGLFGVFSGARHIFLRRHIVRPALRLAAVVFMILSEGDSATLAISYVVVGIAGVAVFLGALVRVVNQSELIQSWDRKRIFSTQETFTYNLPILTSDLVFIFRGALVVILLEYFHNAEEVADFQSVLPLGRLVELVLINFSVLFIPAISRAFASNNSRDILATSINIQVWISLLSFPLFAVGFGFADIITPLLFGESYSSASNVLAWLAVGFYIRVIFGLAPRTLKVLGHLRIVIWIDVVTVAFALIVSIWLIPPFGATGAAQSACLTMVFYGLANQVVLYRVEKIGLWDKVTRGLYGSLISALLGLVILRWVINIEPLILGLAGLFVGCLIPLIYRYHLALNDNFPEMNDALVRFRSKIGFRSGKK